MRPYTEQEFRRWLAKNHPQVMREWTAYLADSVSTQDKPTKTNQTPRDAPNPAPRAAMLSKDAFTIAHTRKDKIEAAKVPPKPRGQVTLQRRFDGRTYRDLFDGSGLHYWLGGRWLPVGRNGPGYNDERPQGRGLYLMHYQGRHFSVELSPAQCEAYDAQGDS